MKKLILVSIILISLSGFSQNNSGSSKKSKFKNKVMSKEDLKITGKVRKSNKNTTPKPNASKSDALPAKKNVKTKNFDAYKTHFIDQLWQLNPVWASKEGFHKYDAAIKIPDEKNRTKKLIAYQTLLNQLVEFDTTLFKTKEKTDYALIDNFLNSSMWYINEYKDYEWNPATYNLGGAFDAVLRNNAATDDEKTDFLSKKLSLVPLYYQQAKTNISKATVEHTELAIKQVKGSLTIFKNDIPDVVNNSTKPNATKASIFNRLAEAIAAIEDYTKWLEKKYLPKIKKDGAARSFRLGKELYTQKFNYDINSKLTADEIYNKALNEKQETLKKMEEIAVNLWPKYFENTSMPANGAVKQLIEKISEQHVDRTDFIEAIKLQIPELKKFVEKHDLVYLDPEKPLVVRETPKYMVGVAGASISSPGPYEKDGETYYNVTPLDNYNDEEAESYLREYNNYMLQILNIHEAIPGHYTQLVEANKVPSIIKSILGNGTMVEGWACYTEKMMLEEGYGNNQPELWLMYYKWLLRIISNTILDYGLHTQNLSESAALDMLVNDAFQETTEALGKIKRAKLTQVQLCSYYTGLTEILELRNLYFEEVKGSLRDFHDNFLSHGSVPVREIEKLIIP